MSNTEMTEAPAAEPSASEQAAAVTEKPKKVKNAKKVVAPKEPKEKRETLWDTLQKAFSKNSSYETILKLVAEKHPTSLFNKNSVLHYNYYRAKYNMAASKSEGEGKFEPTTSVGPVKLAKEPKAKKAKKEAVAEVA